MARPVNASSSSAGPIWGSDASISADGCFRWWLTRRWRHGGRVLIFLGLNPSRADAERDDPTLRRLIGFAGDWGYDALVVVNLFARISASPSVLRRCCDPIGLDADAALLRWCQLWAHQEAWALWCGWGNGGSLLDRAQQVMDLLNLLCSNGLSGFRSRQGHRPSGSPAPASRAILFTHLGDVS